MLRVAGVHTRVMLMVAKVALMSGLVPAAAEACSYANGLYWQAVPPDPVPPNAGFLFQTGPFMAPGLARPALAGPAPIPDMDVTILLSAEDRATQMGWIRFARPLADGQSYTLTVSYPHAAGMAPMGPLSHAFTVGGPADTTPPKAVNLTGAAVRRRGIIGSCPITHPYAARLEWESLKEPAIVTVAESGPGGENPRPLRHEVERGSGPTRTYVVLGVDGTPGRLVCFVIKASDLAGNETPYSAPCCVDERGAQGCPTGTPPNAFAAPPDGGGSGRPSPPIGDAGVSRDAAAPAPVPDDAAASDGGSSAASSSCAIARAGSPPSLAALVLLGVAVTAIARRRRRQ